MREAWLRAMQGVLPRHGMLLQYAPRVHELAVLTMKEATGFYVLCLDTNKEGLEL